MWKKIRKILGRIKYNIEIFLSNLYYIFIHKKNKYKILDDKDVVDKIINEHKSLARYGDGEFKWMLGVKQESFQDDNKEMQERLKEILRQDNKNLILGIPRMLNSLKNSTRKSKTIWKFFIFKNERYYDKYINKNLEYADTNITRFYIGYKDKHGSEKRIENIKRIWNNRDVIIIEGDKTKIGIGNDLLSNAKSIERIIAPNKNAFNAYKKILDSAKKQERDKLFLISLGPTATILAADLSKLGFQAIDIGHVDVEYEWFKMQAREKVPIKGKFVNEAMSFGDLSAININDKNYETSIIERIK